MTNSSKPAVRPAFVAPVRVGERYDVQVSINGGSKVVSSELTWIARDNRGEEIRLVRVGVTPCVFRYNARLGKWTDRRAWGTIEIFYYCDF